MVQLQQESSPSEDEIPRAQSIATSISSSDDSSDNGYETAMTSVEQSEADDEEDGEEEEGEWSEEEEEEEEEEEDSSEEQEQGGKEEGEGLRPDNFVALPLPSSAADPEHAILAADDHNTDLEGSEAEIEASSQDPVTAAIIGTADIYVNQDNSTPSDDEFFDTPPSTPRHDAPEERWRLSGADFTGPSLVNHSERPPGHVQNVNKPYFATIIPKNKVGGVPKAYHVLVNLGNVAQSQSQSSLDLSGDR
ncbi:hypothetical protein AOQ84DRAFT_439412 [Glonium stellatum]|uniref:Uncharacterized protein n=1 Tax=Glonium stellatum TaxID=574774 RepID=A0A8E2JTF4_9PEZI|nr:hypothetical protein AOQ84DRAFT_439412 [Glonium stellatum]